MELVVKYFHEKTDQDYETYNKLWDENKERFIFLHTNLSTKQQMNNIINNLDLDDNKDILAIRFPLIKAISSNKIINDILLGNGIRHNNKYGIQKKYGFIVHCNNINLNVFFIRASKYMYYNTYKMKRLKDNATYNILIKTWKQNPNFTAKNATINAHIQHIGSNISKA